MVNKILLLRQEKFSWGSKLFEGAYKRAYFSKKFKWRELEISYVPIPIVCRKSNISLYYIPRMIQFSRSEKSQILVTPKVEDKTKYFYLLRFS